MPKWCSVKLAFIEKWLEALFSEVAKNNVEDFVHCLTCKNSTELFLVFLQLLFFLRIASYSTMSPHELAQKLLQQECVENFSGCEKEDYIENSSALIGHRIEMSSNYFEFNYKYCASKCVPADWPGSDLSIR